MPDFASTNSVPRRQQTLQKVAAFRSLSLFHGHDVRMQLFPADSGTGIVFRRTDLADSPDIPANCDYVLKEPRRTVLGNREARVETVEHIMAALAGMQIDNCVVALDGPEVPAYDGSCRDFCDGIIEAGVDVQDQDVATLRVDQIQVAQSNCRKQSLVVRPYVHACSAFTYHFDYGARGPVPAQQYSVEITPESFYQEISAARTFVLETEIAALRKMNYGLHLSARDILVFGKNGPIDNRLRWADECVRHKILDCVGDLALSGTVFQGHVTATRTGHHLNHEMAKLLTMMKKGNEGGLLKVI